MAENEQRHRFQMAEQELKQPYVLAQRGQVFGLTALVLLVGLAGYLAYLHQPGWAVAVASLDFAAVVTVFVRGQRQRALVRRRIPEKGPIQQASPLPKPVQDRSSDSGVRADGYENVREEDLGD